MFLMDALCKVTDEFNQANANFPELKSARKGYAKIQEEVSELWAAIELHMDADIVKIRATKVAAMAVRFLHDLC